jgi:phosphatidylinositol-4,5-bisphosphate 3-kinase
MVKEFSKISQVIQNTPPNNKVRELQSQLAQYIQRNDSFICPIDPTVKIKGINIEKCKIMDSNSAPLWIEFTNQESDVESFLVLVKTGNDIRQDLLTLQMFSIMNNLWRENGLDLGMTIYKVVSTGPSSGMIEIVKNSTTTAKIQKEYYGALGALDKRPLKIWLQNNNSKVLWKETIDNFTRSCAAYCVATFVIGICDRHNDNVMVTKAGHLFHIDFGHFLGDVLTFATINRDAAPFVLTPEFVHVMGDENGEDYKRFKELSTKAYLVVRNENNVFLNLFHMMLSTGIAQLSSENIEYLRNALNLGIPEEEAAVWWLGKIDESLATKITQINNLFHNLAHPK